MDDKPRRVQLRRTKGWRMPENTVKVDRTTRWGNPFAPPYVYPALAVEMFRDMMTWGFDPGKLAHLSDRDFRAVCIAKDAWSKRLNYGVEHERAAVTELRGKNLACWCPVINSHGDYAPCHADVLLSLANNISLEEVIRENTRRAKGETL